MSSQVTWNSYSVAWRTCIFSGDLELLLGCLEDLYTCILYLRLLLETVITSTS